MKKWHLVVIGLVLLIIFGTWTVEIFPDPYHTEGKVTFGVWVQRELDELLHGEK